jgi:hypothetical protein
MTALPAIPEPPSTTTGVAAWLEILEPAARLARMIADTDFVPRAMRGNAAAITACVLFGAEIGIGPTQALAKVHIVEGRPAPSAELARSLLLSAGHDMWIEEATTTRVTVAGKRANSDHVQKVTWTMDDAKKAGLAGKQNWAKYPRQMLTARATAELARMVAPDALGGISVFAEEIGDDEPADIGDITPTTTAAAPKAKTRRLAAAPPPAEGPIPSGVREVTLPPLPDEAPIEATATLVAVPDPVEPPPLPDEVPLEGTRPGPAVLDVGRAVDTVVTSARPVENVPLPAADDPTPEPPADVPAGNPIPAGGISNPQIRKLMATYGNLGIRDRADQKRITAELLGLDALGSHNELSAGQASTLIDMLDVLDPFEDIVWDGEEPDRRPNLVGFVPDGAVT